MFRTAPMGQKQTHMNSKIDRIASAIEHDAKFRIDAAAPQSTLEPSVTPAIAVESIAEGCEPDRRMPDRSGASGLEDPTETPGRVPTDDSFEAWAEEEAARQELEEERRQFEADEAIRAAGGCPECNGEGVVDVGGGEIDICNSCDRYLVNQARASARVAELRVWTEMPSAPRVQVAGERCVRCGGRGFLNRGGRVVDCERCISNGLFV